MSANLPNFSGDVPSGATMRPQYMGRTMTTYPVSEPEMDQISMLSAQVTVRFSVASFLLALAAGIWTNAVFATEMTAAGQLASYFVAPLLLLFSVGYAIGGFMARRSRTSAWGRIKSDSLPVTTMVEAGGLMISGNRPPTAKRGRT